MTFVTQYAGGRRAKAQCPRCGLVFPYKAMRPDGYKKNLWVCPTCYDPDHPQEHPVPTADAEALMHPQPLLDDVSGGTAASFATNLGTGGAFTVNGSLVAAPPPGPVSFGKAVTFDGTDDYLTKSGALTGAVNGQKGTVSFWIGGMGVPDGTDKWVRRLGSGTAGLDIWFDGSTGALKITLRDAAGTAIWATSTTKTNAGQSNTMSHVLVAWDLSVPVAHIYIDGNIAARTDATAPTNNLGWSQTGNNLEIEDIGTPSITALSSSKIAYIDNENSSLWVYDFDGTDWARGPGTFNGAGGLGNTITALSSTRVAYIDTVNDELRTYEISGFTWVQVGNSLSISGVGGGFALAALSSSRIAFIDTGNNELRAYDFDGADWSQIGNGLTVSGMGTPSLAALSSSRIAFIDNTNDELRTYDFDGEDWALVGNGLGIDAVGTARCVIAALSSTRVAYIDAVNDELRNYDFDGTDWAQAGHSLSVSVAGALAIAALSVARVALIDQTNNHLRAYSDSYGVYYDADDHLVAASAAASNLLSGSLFDYWEAHDFIDISVEANRRKFIDSLGYPVDLGGDGSNPGVTPIVFLHVAGGVNNPVQPLSDALGGTTFGGGT